MTPPPAIVAARRGAGRRVRDRVARVYSAGPVAADAVALARRAGAAGLGITIGAWTPAAATPAAVLDAHLAAVDGAAAVGGVVAVKAPPLGPAGTAAVLARARAAGVETCLDAHAAADRGAALAVAGPAAGVALPARWPISVHDAARARAADAPVRIVKGQWADPAAPAHDPRAGMLALAAALSGHGRTVRVATHDAPLAAATLRCLRDAGTPCELELLLGLPTRRVVQVAHELGVPVRLYVPFGVADAPYELRRAYRRAVPLRRIVSDVVRAAPPHL